MWRTGPSRPMGSRRCGARISAPQHHADVEVWAAITTEQPQRDQHAERHGRDPAPTHLSCHARPPAMIRTNRVRCRSRARSRERARLLDARRRRLAPSSSRRTRADRTEGRRGCGVGTHTHRTRRMARHVTYAQTPERICCASSVAREPTWVAQALASISRAAPSHSPDATHESIRVNPASRESPRLKAMLVNTA